ncbi:hypothetical protein [Pseudonocardia sp.]|uniref:hypothetical protein n=1 Tax=Pseudonocardia sp. TaxID=60912 RepID=UPI0031FD8252
MAPGPIESFQQVKPYLHEIAKVAVHAGEQEQSRDLGLGLARSLEVPMPVSSAFDLFSPSGSEKFARLISLENGSDRPPHADSEARLCRRRGGRDVPAAKRGDQR